MQEEYRRERVTKELCYYYERKHKTRRLRPRTYGEFDDWIENQLDIARYLGIHWHDLYRKDTDLNALFAEAAKREA